MPKWLGQELAAGTLLSKFCLTSLTFNNAAQLRHCVRTEHNHVKKTVAASSHFKFFLTCLLLHYIVFLMQLLSEQYLYINNYGCCFFKT